MTKPRIISDQEQIAAIDAAVSDGWRITSVYLNFVNPMFGGSSAHIVFSKEIAPPWVDEPVLYPGFQTITQEWGCGLVAGRHAKGIMEAD